MGADGLVLMYEHTVAWLPWPSSFRRLRCALKASLGREITLLAEYLLHRNLRRSWISFRQLAGKEWLVLCQRAEVFATRSTSPLLASKRFAQ
jgi:hypothetical protein